MELKAIHPRLVASLPTESLDVRGAERDQVLLSLLPGLAARAPKAEPKMAITSPNDAKATRIAGPQNPQGGIEDKIQAARESKEFAHALMDPSRIRLEAYQKFVERMESEPLVGEIANALRGELKDLLEDFYPESALTGERKHDNRCRGFHVF